MLWDTTILDPSAKRGPTRLGSGRPSLGMGDGQGAMSRSYCQARPARVIVLIAILSRL